MFDIGDVMGFFNQLFGKRTEPAPALPVEQPVSPIVPISAGFGIAPSSPDTATLEAAEQMRMLALELAQQAGISEYHSQMTEAVLEQAQRLYGSQVRHQSNLAALHRQRFPIDLMAAGLVQPQMQQAPTEPKSRDSSIEAKARRLLGG